MAPRASNADETLADDVSFARNHVIIRSIVPVPVEYTYAPAPQPGA